MPILALNVRTNHVHCVLVADRRPELVLGQLKTWATRRLLDAGLRSNEERVWTREGSTHHLFYEDAVARAVRYVETLQGSDLD